MQVIPSAGGSVQQSGGVLLSFFKSSMNKAIEPLVKTKANMDGRTGFHWQPQMAVPGGVLQGASVNGLIEPGATEPPKALTS